MFGRGIEKLSRDGRNVPSSSSHSRPASPPPSRQGSATAALTLLLSQFWARSERARQPRCRQRAARGRGLRTGRKIRRPEGSHSGVFACLEDGSTTTKGAATARVARSPQGHSKVPLTRGPSPNPGRGKPSESASKLPLAQLLGEAGAPKAWGRSPGGG